MSSVIFLQIPSSFPTYFVVFVGFSLFAFGWFIGQTRAEAAFKKMEENEGRTASQPPDKTA